jgi:AAA15 family ATPase/GTPase
VPFLGYRESLKRLIRIENKSELFYSFSGNQCEISTDSKSIKIPFNENLDISLNEKMCYHFEDNKLRRHTPITGSLHKESIENNIKRYTFQTNNRWKSIGGSQLLPPFGENIIDVFSYNTDLSDVKAWMRQEFTKSGMEYVLDKSSNSLKVQKRLGNDEVFILPYSSIADTLQRVIFYKTAIASNKNSVLLFEEPEAHAFPPYIAGITRDIIDAETNQFFIVTHSPYVITDFLEYENLRKEVAIYLFDFKNNQTVVKRLTSEEIDEVYNYDIDLFFNIERFLRDD